MTSGQQLTYGTHAAGVASQSSETHIQAHSQSEAAIEGCPDVRSASQHRH